MFSIVLLENGWISAFHRKVLITNQTTHFVTAIPVVKTFRRQSTIWNSLKFIQNKVFGNAVSYRIHHAANIMNHDSHPKKAFKFDRTKNFQTAILLKSLKHQTISVFSYQNT